MIEEFFNTLLKDNDIEGEVKIISNLPSRPAIEVNQNVINNTNIQ
jgi:hypothetical protein